MLTSRAGKPLDLTYYNLAFEFSFQVSDLLFCRAGQAALKAYDKATKVTAERERYRTDRDLFRQKSRTWEQQAKDVEAKVEGLKKELADATAVAELSEAEEKKVKEEEKEKMRIADSKGYEVELRELPWSIPRLLIRW